MGDFQVNQKKSISEYNVANSHGGYTRYINPSDVALPPGYKIEAVAYGLETPISLAFTEEGDLLIGDSGVRTGNGKVLKMGTNNFEVIAEGFNPPLTGITYLNGEVYVSHRGKITLIKRDGSKVDILSGLPSFGDHHNNKVEFGQDGKMYFGQGTATNAGVVGLDNSWVQDYPFFHDYPGSDIKLKGYNYITENMLSKGPEDTVTGAYSPFGVPTMTPDVNGITRTSGSVLRANLDGTDLELIAWGLRNPFRLRFDQNNQLWAGNHGADVRGSRPIANCPDEFQLIRPYSWYGWPDYTGGQPVTLPKFRPANAPQPQFLWAEHPQVTQPFALFEPHSAIMGFDFDYFPLYGSYGDAYIAEFGSEAPETTGGKRLPFVGHRVSRIDMRTGQVTPFAINKTGMAASATGGGGLERPIDVLFGPDKAMYVSDFAVTKPNEPDEFYPNSGMIWRIYRSRT